MISQALLMIASFLAGLIAVIGLSKPGQDKPAQQDSDSGFAVVELFTSQGCSSCPPADRVLAELAETLGDDRPIYLLSFHVDYWNQLGWDDPYSLPISTARQKAYARAWSSRRVYTPQMVVNGTYEFNGGNEKNARLAIDEGLAQKAETKIQLRTQVDKSEMLATISYRIEGPTKDHILNVALVLPEVANEVPHGENRGRRLKHVNVVRSFKSKRLDQAEGSIELTIPADFDLETGVTIAYVQRRADTVLTGAAEESLKTP